MDELKFLRELEYSYEPGASEKNSVPREWVRSVSTTVAWTYIRRLSMVRFLKNRHGRTGSIVVLRFVTYRSQASNVIHSKPDTESKLIT